MIYLEAFIIGTALGIPWAYGLRWVINRLS